MQKNFLMRYRLGRTSKVQGSKMIMMEWLRNRKRKKLIRSRRQIGIKF